MGSEEKDKQKKTTMVVTEKQEEEEEEDGDGGGGKYEEALSPASLLFHAPRFDCYIIGILGSKVWIDVEIVKQGLKQTLIKHPRFSSKLVINDKRNAKKKWTQTTVNVDDHIVVPELNPEIENPDKFVEDYISYMTTIPMDLSRPLWELHILNIRTSEAEAIGVFRMHHSIGDGTSLISLLLACTRKISDPSAVPSVPGRKQTGLSLSRGRRGGFWWIFVVIWNVIRLVWNTIADLLVFFATILFLKDTNSPIKGGKGVESVTKRFVHKTISLDDIKLVKNSMNVTVNDVILGITQAGLSLYLNRRHESQYLQNGEAKGKSNNYFLKKIRLRSAILVNIRPSNGIQDLADMMAKKSKVKWGNWIGQILIPFKIALRENPLDYIHDAKSTIDRKKNSLEALCTFLTAKFLLKTVGVKVAANLAHRLLSNTTLSFSNVAGPCEEIGFYGHPMAYLAPTVYGHPHALTIHFQSYINDMKIVLAVDPNVIPDPQQLCEDIKESLEIIKTTILEKKGVIKDEV